MANEAPPTHLPLYEQMGTRTSEYNGAQDTFSDPRITVCDPGYDRFHVETQVFLAGSEIIHSYDRPSKAPQRSVDLPLSDIRYGVLLLDATLCCFVPEPAERNHGRR